MKRLARGGCPLLCVTSDSRLAWTGGSPKTTSVSSSSNTTSGSPDSQWKWHFSGSHYSVRKTWYWASNMKCGQNIVCSFYSIVPHLFKLWPCFHLIKTWKQIGTMWFTKQGSELVQCSHNVLKRGNGLVQCSHNVLKRGNGLARHSRDLLKQGSESIRYGLVVLNWWNWLQWCGHDLLKEVN